MGNRITGIGMARWRLCLALTAMLLAGCAPSGPQALLQGERLIRSGRHAEAVAKLERAVRLLPDKAQAWNYLGIAYQATQQPALAAQAYQQALKLNRQMVVVRYNLGCLRLEQNNAAEAIAELTTYTLLQPDSVDGWLKLGQAQMRLSHWTPAGHCFEQALKLREQAPEAWNGLGLVLVQRGQYRDALHCFSSALRHQTNYAPALLNEAILYHQTFKNRPLALQRYRAYLALRPPPANKAEVEQLVARLDPPPLVTAPPAPSALTAAVVVALSGDRHAGASSTDAGFSNAIARTTTVTATLPAGTGTTGPVAGLSSPERTLTNKIVTRKIGGAAVGTGNSLGASGNVPSAVKPSPSPALVESRAERKVLPLPVEQSLPGPSTNPLVQPANLESSVRVAPASRSGALVSQEKPAIMENPQLPAPEPLTPAKPSVSAANTATEVRAGIPASSSIKPRASGVTPLPEVSSFPSGPSAISRYPYRSPAVPAAGNRVEAGVPFNRGIEAHAKGAEAVALEFFRKAVDMDPSWFEAQNNAALVAFRLGDYPRALAGFEVALAIKGDSLSARYDFALALAKAGYPRDAARELEHLLAQGGVDPRAYLLLGNLYAQQLYEPQNARRNYWKLLELDPQNPQAAELRSWLAAHP